MSRRIKEHSESALKSALARIKEILGPKGWADDPVDMAPYLKEQRGNYQSAAALVVYPNTTLEVSTVVSICAETGIGIVPQGGNTGLTGGSVGTAHGRDIILSTRRLNRIRAIDPVNDTIVVEAGVILQRVQQAAAEVDRLFPLSLGAEGTCQIGGNLSTNAGGTGVLRYGNARDLVLGLEVVLACGQIWDGLRSLRKDNTGYDLKHLFLGAEGTLGIITAAVLKLFPKPRQIDTALLAVPDPAAAIDLLPAARSAGNGALSAFELMPRQGLDFALRYIAGTIDPLPRPYDWYVLLELSSLTDGNNLRSRLEALLHNGFEKGLVLDAVIAGSITQSRQFWRLREGLVEGELYEGGSIRHDVSVPISRIPNFINQAVKAVQAKTLGIRPVAFGHIGDGNVHFNLIRPVDMDCDAFLAKQHELSDIVHDIAAALGGSFSAEHGIGLLKRDELGRRKPLVEIELMRRIKQALDPTGIMNPHKTLPEQIRRVK
jgi:FAD/FMN-containing dehydrogenase